MILFNENEINDIENIGDLDVAEPEATNEGYSGDMEGMMQIMVETTEDWAVLQEAIMYGDMVELMESHKPGGNAVVIHEANVSDLFERVKQFFRRLWARITEFFKNFLDQINRWLMSEKAFIAKYEDLFNKAIANLPGSWERNGTNWADFNAMATQVSRISTQVQDISKTAASHVNAHLRSDSGSPADNREAIEKSFEDGANAFRGTLLQTNAITASDFNKTLKWTIRNGGKRTDKEPDAFKYTKNYLNSNKGSIIAELKSAADTRKTVATAKKGMDTGFKAILSAIDKQKQEASRRKTTGAGAESVRSAEVSIYSKAHSSFKSMMAAASRTCGAITSGMRARNFEYRGLIVAVVGASRRELRESDDGSGFDADGIHDLDGVNTAEINNHERITPTQEGATGALGRYLEKKGFN